MKIWIFSKKKWTRYISIPLCLVLFFCLFSLFFSSSCRYYNLERKLSPDDADWFNRIRYIISTKESHIFLDLPDSEKEQFREDFWKRRDPDPGTEENEFKMEYYNRMEQADDMFHSEGRPGWLTDRGRIYILFGPPMDRIINSMSAYQRCQEVWYYGNFPVVFVDPTCTGDFRLVTYDLSPISRSLNLMYMHEINMAQAKAMQTISGQEHYFDFNWSIKKTKVETGRIEGVIEIEVPYASIWFKEQDDKLSTVLDLRLELVNAEKKLVWEHKESFEVEATEEMLNESKKSEYKFKVPFVIEKNFGLLTKEGNKIVAILVNRTGGVEQRKIRDFNL